MAQCCIIVLVISLFALLKLNFCSSLFLPSFFSLLYWSSLFAHLHMRGLEQIPICDVTHATSILGKASVSVLRNKSDRLRSWWLVQNADWRLNSNPVTWVPWGSTGTCELGWEFILKSLLRVALYEYYPTTVKFEILSHTGREEEFLTVIMGWWCLFFFFPPGHPLIFYLITATFARTLSLTKPACPRIWGLFSPCSSTYVVSKKSPWVLTISA